MGKLAALSSGLLARKGQAKPAMRPQGFAGYTAPVEDLGWNDMGSGQGDWHVASVTPIALQPEPQPEPVAELPPVLVARAELAAKVEPPIAIRTVSVATATRIKRETARTTKAAFTLRLDAERHLRLRLAGAVTGRSAQSLMTDALDALIATMPEVETLVAQLPAGSRR